MIDVGRSQSLLVLSAGMPRSASTWAFNALRLILDDALPQAKSSWVDDWLPTPVDQFTLLKIHNVHEGLVKRADLIVYTYRDVRDAVVSMQRMFGNKPTMALIDGFLEQFDQWSRVADLTFRYESLGDKRDAMVKLHTICGLTPNEIDEKLATLASMRYEDPGSKNNRYHSENLLHKGHVTDGRSGLWQGVLDKGLLAEVEAKHKDWFRDHDYLLSQ